MIRKYFQTSDDEHEFKPILAEIESRPVSPIGRTLFWIIIAVFLFFSIWLYFGKVDVVVSARGRIIPDGEIKIIQSLNTGVLNKIACRPGDFVKVGDMLVEIDPSTTAPVLDTAKKNQVHYTLEIERLQALLSNTAFEPTANRFEPKSLKIQTDIYNSTKEAFESILASKQRKLDQIKEQLISLKSDKGTTDSLLRLSLRRLERLEKVQDLLALESIERERENILNYQNTLVSVDQKAKELEHLKSQMNHEIAYERQNFQQQLLKELAEKQRLLGELEEEIHRAEFLNLKQVIKSPINGYINELYVHTIGGVVTPAQNLVSIVPDKTLLVIEAKILNKDVGFVEINMPVSIKIDTFDFQKYGMIDGNVSQISKDSIIDEQLGPVFKTYIDPQKTWLLVEGKETQILSGMTVTAEVNVGKRRIIEFFVYPLIKYLDEGMSVR